MGDSISECLARIELKLDGLIALLDRPQVATRK